GLRQGILAWGLVLGALTVAVAQEEKPAVPVDAAPVVSQALSEVLSAAGALAPNESVVIRPEIDGKIAAIHFQEGQHIDGGVLMFTLDDVLYKAQLAEAKANYELSKQNSERATQLLSSRAGT